MITELRQQESAFFILPTLSIRCAIFNEALVTPYGDVNSAIVIDSSDLRSGANFSFTKFSLNVLITNSASGGAINLNAAKVAGGIGLSGSKLPSTLLIGANIDGGVDLTGTNLDSMNGTSLSVAQGVNASSARIGSLVLLESKISGGVNLVGAKIYDLVTFNAAVINGPLLMHTNGFFRSVDLTGTSIGGGLELSDSVFGQIHAESLNLLGFLAAGHARMGSFDLGSSNMGENVILEGAYIANELSMNGARIAGGVILRSKGSFGNVNLFGATIGQTLELTSSSFRSRIAGGDIKVGGSVFCDGIHAANVDFANARFNGSVGCGSSHLSKELSFNGASIAGGLYLRDHGNYQDVDLTAVEVGRQLELNSSTFLSLKANGAKVGKDLLIYDSKVRDFTAINSHVSGNILANGMNVAKSFTLNGGVVTASIIMHDVKGATAVFDMQAVNVGLNLELNGANIEQVDVGSIVVGRILSADAASIGEFELGHAKIDGDLQANQAAITKTLDLNSANLGGSLILRDCICGSIDIDVTVASVGNAAQLNRGKFHNLLGFGVRVDNRLEAVGATFNSVNLRDAQVTGAVDFDDISVADEIDLSNLNAKGALSIGRSSQKSAPKIGSLNVSGSTIAGDLNLDHLTFGASIYASGSEIGGNLLLHDLFESDTTKPASIDFSGSKVSQSILLSPVSINGDINLSRTVIGNALWLRPNDQGFTWRPATNIQLSNTKTTLLMGELANWKTSADTWVSANLTGFSYDEIASVPKHATASTKPGCEGDMYFAKVDCLIAWLSVNNSPISGGQAAARGFNPGAYEQLAATLQRMGRLDDAKDVLFASGVRRLQTSAWPNNIFVFITALTGFGQRPYYLLILLGLLFALGYIISFWSHDLCERDRRETFRQKLRHCARSSPRHPLVRLGSVARPAKPLVAGALVFCFCNGFRRLLYAVDNGLPMGITLVKSHENISHEKNPWVLCFFLIQKGLGYAIFLIAFAALVQSLIPKS